MTKRDGLRNEILHSSVDDILNMLDAARAEGAAEVLANPISRGTLYINTGGVGDLPDGKYPIITVLAPKESEQDNTTEEEYEDMRRNGGPEVKP